MLGIGCPDPPPLPPITLVEIALTTTRAPLPRERVRSSTPSCPTLRRRQMAGSGSDCGPSCAPASSNLVEQKPEGSAAGGHRFAASDRRAGERVSGCSVIAFLSDCITHPGHVPRVTRPFG